MNPDVWYQLMRAWGFCDRHAWVHLNVEMAFRQRYLLGRAILYLALIDRGVRAVAPRPLASRSRIGLRLRPNGSCLICEMNLDPAICGAAPLQRLDRGRDTSILRAFAIELAPLWRSRVCTLCSGGDDDIGKNLCRSHLVTELSAGRHLDVATEQAALRDLACHLNCLRSCHRRRSRRVYCRCRLVLRLASSACPAAITTRRMSSRNRECG
jgi:hypothetical protein